MCFVSQKGLTALGWTVSTMQEIHRAVGKFSPVLRSANAAARLFQCFECINNTQKIYRLSLIARSSASNSRMAIATTTTVQPHSNPTMATFVDQSTARYM